MEPSVVGTLTICILGPHHWTRWLPCPYMIKKKKKNLLQNQESFKAEPSFSASGFKVYHVCSDDDPRMTFTFLPQGQICIPLPNFEKSFSQYVLKADG